MKIEVKSLDVKIREFPSKRTGELMRFRDQCAYAHTGKCYPVEIKLQLKGDAAPYPIGDYQLAPDSYYVDEYGNLKISPRLVRMPAAAVRSA